MTADRWWLYVVNIICYLAAFAAVLYVARRRIPTAAHSVAFLPWLVSGIAYMSILLGLAGTRGFHDPAPSHMLAWWGLVTFAVGPVNLVVCIVYLARRWRA